MIQSNATRSTQPNETVDFTNANNVNGERRSLFLVSIPGLNEWAVDEERRRNDVGPFQPHSNAFGDIPSGGGKKRTIDDVDDQTDVDMETTQKTPPQPASTAATSNATASQPAASILSAQYLVNSPLPARPGKACLAKVYDTFDDFKLNTLVEVIGFLSVNPVLDASTHAPDEQDDDHRNAAEQLANNPPPSLVPRLHCVHVRPLPHANPLLSARAVGKTDCAATTIDEPTEAVDFYRDIHLALTQCLFGDALAAEYLVCHLISTVYIRATQNVGQFALNLSNIPAAVLPSYTDELYAVLESLLPVSHMLPLTLDNLNTLQFEPKKDYATGKLTSGVLQLAPHTHLVLDETRLLAGKLEAGGVAAVQSLAHLIAHQELRVDFQFYQLNYEANVAVLCLSEGRSMLPTNCRCELRPTDATAVAQIRETLAAAGHFLRPKLAALRRTLTELKMAEFEVGEGILETIQSDFVEMRKAERKVGAEDLHALLVLSRLLGLSRGRRTLDGEMWERAKRLEVERLGRLEKKN